MSVAAVVAFVAHPELRLLLPVIDAIGVDVFVGLLGIQVVSLIGNWAQPYVVLVGIRLVPWLRVIDRSASSVAVFRGLRNFLSYGVFHWAGRGGQRLWFRLHNLMHAVPGPVPDQRFKGTLRT